MFLTSLESFDVADLHHLTVSLEHIGERQGASKSPSLPIGPIADFPRLYRNGPYGESNTDLTHARAIPSLPPGKRSSYLREGVFSKNSLA